MKLQEVRGKKMGGDEGMSRLLQVQSTITMMQEKTTNYRGLRYLCSGCFIL